MITVVHTNKVVPLDNRPDTGVVAVEAPVNAHRFGGVAHRLFEALGQTSAATGNRVTATKHQVPLLIVAFISRDTQTVVVDHVERCGISSLTHLIHTTVAAGVELVAVTHPPVSDHMERTFAAWPHRQAHLAEVLDLLTGPAPVTEPGPPTPVEFPTVPDTEFPHFLTACRYSLAPEDYTTVDGEYRRALIAVRAEVEADPTGSGALESLRRHLHDATSSDHALTIVRAGTAAAFPAGLLITCPAEQLRAVITAEPYFRARHHHDWDALHTYRRPERAAVAVLATAGLTAAQMCALTVADADRLDPRLPPPARVHLRRVVLHREIAGAESSESLLTLADGRPMTTRWIREALLDIGRSSDIPADRQRRRSARESEYQWATRLGLRVRSL